MIFCASVFWVNVFGKLSYDALLNKQVIYFRISSLAFSQILLTSGRTESFRFSSVLFCSEISEGTEAFYALVSCFEIDFKETIFGVVTQVSQI